MCLERNYGYRPGWVGTISVVWMPCARTQRNQQESLCGTGALRSMRIDVQEDCRIIQRGIYQPVFARDSRWGRHSLNYSSTLTLTLSTHHCCHRREDLLIGLHFPPLGSSPVLPGGGFPPHSGGNGSSSALLYWEPTMGDGWVV